MPKPSFQRERDVALAAVRDAAGLCRAVQASIDTKVLKKKDRSPVTVADFGSQALVCRALRAAFPDDPIIAEEDSAALQTPENEALLAQVIARVQAVHPHTDRAAVCRWIDYGNAPAYTDRFWTLDPIDGTKGFLRGEQYAIALALIVGGEVRVAALACPNLPASRGEDTAPGVLFSAVKGQGTTSCLLDGAGTARSVHVSPLDDPSQARFCESVESGHSAHGEAARVADHLGITKPPRRLDSQAKYALVARGEADLYLRLPTRPGYVEKIWDHAAGTLVVTEAGGRVTDLHGKPLEFFHGRGLEQNTGIVVSNGLLHEAVLAALDAVNVS